MNNGMESSINAAVRRRDTLLASAPALASTIPDSVSQPADTASVDVAATSETTAASSPSSLSSSGPSTATATATGAGTTSSQSIAQSVLSTSGQTAGPLNSDMSKLAAALSSGAGVPNNPIVVTLAERKAQQSPCISSLHLCISLSQRCMDSSTCPLPCLHGCLYFLCVTFSLALTFVMLMTPLSHAHCLLRPAGELWATEGRPSSIGVRAHPWENIQV